MPADQRQSRERPECIKGQIEERILIASDARLRQYQDRPELDDLINDARPHARQDNQQHDDPPITLARDRRQSEIVERQRNDTNSEPVDDLIVLERRQLMSSIEQRYNLDIIEDALAHPNTATHRMQQTQHRQSDQDLEIELRPVERERDEQETAEHDDNVPHEFIILSRHVVTPENRNVRQIEDREQEFARIDFEIK